MDPRRLAVREVFPFLISAPLKSIERIEIVRCHTEMAQLPGREVKLRMPLCLEQQCKASENW